MTEKGPGADLSREPIGYAALRQMELEIGSRAGVECIGKSAAWLARHNSAARYINSRSRRLLAKAET